MSNKIGKKRAAKQLPLRKPPSVREAPKIHFKSLLTSVRTISVDPECCISLYLIRSISKSGARMLMHHFQVENQSSVLQRAPAAGNITSVIPFTGMYSNCAM